MTNWETLELAIPRGAAKRIAHALRVSEDYVRRWRREPLGDEAPNGTGQRSPLDRVCDLLDAVFLTNPKGARLIVEAVQWHYDCLVEAQAYSDDSFNGSSHSRAIASANLLTESTEAINALNVDGLTKHTLQQLVEMRDAADCVIARVRRSQTPDSRLQTPDFPVADH